MESVGACWRPAGAYRSLGDSPARKLEPVAQAALRGFGQAAHRRRGAPARGTPEHARAAPARKPLRAALERWGGQVWRLIFKTTCKKARKGAPSNTPPSAAHVQDGLQRGPQRGPVKYPPSGAHVQDGLPRGPQRGPVKYPP